MEEKQQTKKETMQTRIDYSEIFKEESYNLEFCALKILKNEGEIKTLSNKNGGNLFPVDLSCKKC